MELRNYGKLHSSGMTESRIYGSTENPKGGTRKAWINGTKEHSFAGLTEPGNYELTDNSSKVAVLRTHEITEQWTIKRNTTRLKQLENGKTSVIPLLRLSRNPPKSNAQGDSIIRSSHLCLRLKRQMHKCLSLAMISVVVLSGCTSS